MPQSLKPEIKDKILTIAKDEFYSNGFSNASMRDIASKVGVTVGNLYRYFKSKDEIYETIVSSFKPILFNKIKDYTNNKLALTASVFGVKVDVDGLKKTLDNFSNDLVFLYEKDKTLFVILMNDEEIVEILTTWFRYITYELISHNNTIPEYDIETTLLKEMNAINMYECLVKIFSNDSLIAKKKNKLLKICFRSFIYKLDNDLRQYLGE